MNFKQTLMYFLSGDTLTILLVFIHLSPMYIEVECVGLLLHFIPLS